MSKSMKRIHKVVIKRMVDESPDTSWLGEYSSDKTSEYSLDRAHDEDCPSFDNEDGEECTCNFDGYWHNGEYRYFNPSFNYVDKHGHAKDLTPEEVRKYTRDDYGRMERLNSGDCFIGIRADAEYSVGGSPAPIQEVTSGGLWGIESDSDSDFLTDTENEQLHELKAQLKAIGFSSRAISAAFKSIERTEN